MRIGWKILLGFGAPIVTVALGLVIIFGPFTTDSAPSVSRLVVDSRGQITLDGVPVTEAQLLQELKRLGHDRPEPELHFEPDSDAPGDSVDRALAAVKKSSLTEKRLVGSRLHPEAGSGKNTAQ